MSIKFEKDVTSYAKLPGETLVKSRVKKSDLDDSAASMGQGNPYDASDINDWNSVRTVGYTMKLDGCHGFSVHKDGKEIGSAGSTNPGSPLTSSELRNHFKRAVQIATNHQLAEASAAVREGVQPQFLSGDVWGDEGTIPDDQESVSIHDGKPLAKLAEEDLGDDANGGSNTKKASRFGEGWDEDEAAEYEDSAATVNPDGSVTIGKYSESKPKVTPKTETSKPLFREEDLIPKKESLGPKNQGWVKKAEKKASPIEWRDENTMDEEEHHAHYQNLVNTGMAWRLEGAVGRTAMEKLRAGHIMLGERAHHDAYGNKVPSRHEVKDGSMGSASYVAAMKAKRDSE